MKNKSYIEAVNEAVNILNNSEVRYGDWKALLITFSILVIMYNGEIDASLNILGHSLLEANVIDVDEEVYNECKNGIKNILGLSKTK